MHAGFEGEQVVRGVEKEVMLLLGSIPPRFALDAMRVRRRSSAAACSAVCCSIS